MKQLWTAIRFKGDTPLVKYGPFLVFLALITIVVGNAFGLVPDEWIQNLPGWMKDMATGLAAAVGGYFIGTQAEDGSEGGGGND